MSLLAAALVVVAAFVTATVSGVLGMAGGLLLMGVLLLVLPVYAVASFQSATRWVVTAIGVVYLVQAGYLAAS